MVKIGMRVDRPEQQRRNDVSRYKIFVKVLFNGKEVSKTESKCVHLFVNVWFVLFYDQSKCNTFCPGKK